MYRRNRRNTDIIFAAVYHNRHSTILWLSFFGNIHAAHDLDSRGDCRKKAVVVNHFFIKRAIDTVTDTYLGFKCFNMNITSSLTNCLLDQRTNQLYDRCITDICFFYGIFYISTKLLSFPGKSPGSIHRLRSPMATVNRCQDITWCCDIWFNLKIGNNRNVIDCCHIHRICHRQMQDIGIVWIQFKRNTLVFFQQVDTDQVAYFLRNRDSGKLYYLQSELCLECTGDHFFRNKSILNQNFTDFFTGSFL